MTAASAGVQDPAAGALRRRDARGRFRGSWNPVELYQVVREVTLEATRVDPDPLKDPTSVSTRSWNEARFSVAARYGRLPPQANEILRQLKDRDGLSFTWPGLLQLVFSETDLKRAHEKRLGADERTVGADGVVYSLLLIASWLDVGTLAPDRYREGCEERMTKAGRAERRALEQHILTVGQIVHAVGSWDNGLELAGLQPRQSQGLQGRAAAPVPDAIAAYFGWAGCLPTRKQLYEFARDSSFALAALRGRPWREWITAGTQRIAELRLPPPPPYGTRNSRDWKPIAVPGLTDYPRGRRSWPRRDVLEAVQRFAESLRPGETPTQRRWRSFAREQSDVPAWNALRRHGTLVELVQEVSRPDWRRRVQEVQNARAPTAEERAERERARLVKRSRNEQAKMLLRAISVRREARPRELAEALGWNIHRLRSQRQVLSAAGLIEPVNERHSKSQAYRLTGAGLTCLNDETS